MTERYGWDQTPTPDLGLDISKAPADVQKLYKWIIEKMYGKDVASAYGQAMVLTGILAKNAEAMSLFTSGKMDALTTYVDDMMLEMTDKDVISAPEIIAMRDGEVSAGARLDRDQSKNTNHMRGLVSIDFAEDCGGVGDGEFNNYNAFINLKNLIDSHGKAKVKVLFPPGDYAYKPLLPLSTIWRDLMQPVDFDQIFYFGQGARIIQIKDSTWNANGTPSGMLEHESPIQFRRGKTVYIEGLEIMGDRVPYTGIDGSCCGIYLRNVEGFVVRDGKVSGWGTDGMTISRDYGNGDKSKDGLVENCIFDNNTRQGVSVTGGDDITFFRCQFKNTNGGSFGHGLDLETNTGSQKNIKVVNCDFYNNQRGAMNVIGTTDVVLDGCYVDEPNCNGAFYFDGSSLPTRNVKVLNTTIITDKAVLYLGGTDVKEILFENCDITTIGRANEGATIRLVPAVGNAVDNITFRKCKFKGIGGILSKISGKFNFEDCEMTISNISSLSEYPMVFQVDGEGNFKNSKIHIDETVSFSTKTFKIAKGKFDGMDLISHASAPVRLVDDRNDATANVEIGLNKFSEFFYYWGEVFALSAYDEKRIIEKSALGRVVHGGFNRTTQGKNTKVGDVVQMFTTDNKLRTYVCTVAGSPGTWVMTQGV